MPEIYIHTRRCVSACVGRMAVRTHVGAVEVVALCVRVCECVRVSVRASTDFR